MIPQISRIDLVQLASGDRLFLQVYKFIGEKPGKKAYIQANLHGSEIIGNAVIYELIEFLMSLEPEEMTGEIWLVPVCNPLSTNQRHHFFSTGRFNSYDGKDWNRIFWDGNKDSQDLSLFAESSLEFDAPKIAKKYLLELETAFKRQLEEIESPCSVPFDRHYRYLLQSLCLDANYVIDIHSSSNQGMDYLYCFSSREESAEYFLLDFGILMHEYDGVAFDEAFMKPWLVLEKKLATLGREIKFDIESWTLELGSGMQINPKSLASGVRGIKNYLLAKGMLSLFAPNSLEVETNRIRLFDKKKIQRYYAATGGMIRARAPLGSEVNSGEIVYQILSFDKTGEVPNIREVRALNKGLVFDVSTNQSVNQGEYVLTIVNDE